MSKEKILHDGSRAMADVSRGLSSRRLSCVSREWVYNRHALCIFIGRSKRKAEPLGFCLN